MPRQQLKEKETKMQTQTFTQTQDQQALEDVPYRPQSASPLDDSLSERIPVYQNNCQKIKRSRISIQQSIEREQAILELDENAIAKSWNSHRFATYRIIRLIMKAIYEENEAQIQKIRSALAILKTQNSRKFNCIYGQLKEEYRADIMPF